MRFWKPVSVPGAPVVGIAVAAYLEGGEFGLRTHAGLCCLIDSFAAQTYHDWKMLIVHDGPAPSGEAQGVLRGAERDKRVVATETEFREQKFGHPHRQMAIDRLIESGCEWIGLTNQDNYYMPVYLEWMLHEVTKTKAKFVYCDMVHSHKLWKPVTTEIKRGKIDLGCFLVHRDVAKKIRFDQTHFAADWDYIARVKAEAKKVAKVHATLFAHN